MRGAVPKYDVLLKSTCEAPATYMLDSWQMRGRQFFMRVSQRRFRCSAVRLDTDAVLLSHGLQKVALRNTSGTIPVCAVCRRSGPQ